MPDRSLRLLRLLPSTASGPSGAAGGVGRRALDPSHVPTFLPSFASGHQGGVREGLVLRERQPSSPATPPREGEGSTPESGGSGPEDGASSPQSPGAPADDNPFAPPPEGTPDRPWQPRRPANGQGSDDGQGDGDRSPWGSQWSDRQPGPAQGGGFGDRPGSSGGPGGPGGQGGPEGPGGGSGAGLRWDPADPAQRRARYALLSGMWAFFFALFSWPYVALLLGALALYWGSSALRAKPRTPDPDTPAPTSGARPQTTAAISGLVTASLALIMVAATFTAQLVYRDYYTCVNDALTNTAKESCDHLLPEELRNLLGTR
ncbi:hypothetical protein [Streptomyces sporangiiformans]|uniref:hypothetical protein n=1 Tax=Streptomyces sporangiiformans TaxID=2315329 RepID=UPI001F09932D|nr:hypothetical protein [Streptomyces sporangiiformans]